MNKLCNNNLYENFYENVTPTKLTEARRLKLNNKGWGLITDFYLESVKINNYKKEITSSATLKIADRSGQISCVVKGPSVGILFGLSKEEWKSIEQLCFSKDQLFYRYFKKGLKECFNCEQKMFYNFCSSSQTSDVLVAIFKRCVNFRSNQENDAFLQILDLRKCDDYVLDLYTNTLRDMT